MLHIAVSLLLVARPQAAFGVNPSEMLSDPALELRAREISKELRCVVCQNQSIDESDATLARDLRVLVRERLAAGDDDQGVIDYVVSRYGDFVLLRPPVKGATLALWGGPIAIALFALIAVFVFFRRQRQTAKAPIAATPLNEQERQRLQDLLAEKEH